MNELLDRTVQILSDLVSFDTTSRKSNLPIVDYIEDLLEHAGAWHSREATSDGAKAGVLAAAGPRLKPGLILSAHTDVVPAAAADWSNDPFTLTRVGQQLIGRGACDMKGFVACCLAWLETLPADRLAAPVWLALSRDEELGCIGAADLIRRFESEGGSARLCVVGEPTELDVVVAHKGILQIRADVRGTEAHSSLAPRAVNAVQSAAKLITHLSDMATDRIKRGPFDRDYDIPHSTIHTGTIRGGTVANIVPKHCTFEFELRYLPDEGKDTFLASVQEYVRSAIEPEMTAICPQCGFTFTVVADAPGLRPPTDRELVATTAEAAGDRSVRSVAFATDAGHFDQAGIPTLVCGPGSIVNAHKPDEFIDLEQLDRCLSFLNRLGRHFLW